MASRTLSQHDLTWSGSTLLAADDAIGAVRELRAREGKGLQVMGSPSLAAQLIECLSPTSYVDRGDGRARRVDRLPVPGSGVAGHG